MEGLGSLTLQRLRRRRRAASWRLPARWKAIRIEGARLGVIKMLLEAGKGLAASTDAMPAPGPAVECRSSP